MRFRTINHTQHTSRFLTNEGESSFDVHRDSPIKLPSGSVTINIGSEYEAISSTWSNSQGNPVAGYIIIIKLEVGEIWAEAPIPFRKYFYTRSQMRNRIIDNLICQ